ncbi:endolytic transglycosylase MltG [Humibacter sp. BT305]|nr:endolytic transglycosylase MltG [Humibacter sp. BT305]
MTDRRPPEDHPFAEFFSEPEQPATRREARVQTPTRRSRSHRSGKGPRRWVVPLIVTVVIVGLLGGAGVFLYNTFGAQVQSMLAGKESDDYTGSGTGEVMFVINSGDDGSVIAENLQAADVVKSSGTFYDLLLQSDPVFQPGTYKLASQMSSRAALDALQDPANKVDYTATIPEGTTAAGVLQILADATGMPLADFQAAAANYTALGVPAEAPSIEGFLFPATYTFEPGQTPTDMLQAMVNRTFQSLDTAGVAPADRFRVLTLAALIQKEAGSDEDMYKVSRVFLNRIDQRMNLQSDATVAYGAGHTNVETTQAERDDASNPYNTYANPGLPVGPISNPGDVAIDAALHPADGPWLYFVTVNLDTGETVFSTTEAEHDAAVQQLQEWWAEHPEYR